LAYFLVLPKDYILTFLAHPAYRILLLRPLIAEFGCRAFAGHTLVATDCLATVITRNRGDEILDAVGFFTWFSHFGRLYEFLCEKSLYFWSQEYRR